ncbi:MAG: hypothetical protein CVU05_09050 [Bacteroidetes bacterium HGW-Bacteroidetes-21]|jgi:hypothetical protein|nr:MAG: hypothetical protein CVU05_09050 [Bacteroidetes bacterium HGW-Bacteroidetes-21]
MYYNISYRRGFPPKEERLFVLEELELEKFIEDYQSGKNTFFYNGCKNRIEDISHVEIYDVSKISFKSKQEYLEKIIFEQNLAKLSKVPFNLAEFGSFVTNNYIKGSWGYKKQKSSFFTVSRTNIYVDETRIDELRNIKNDKFDYAKLIRLCEELNSSYSQSNFYATGMLVRAIIDHVPPLFGYKKFEELANHYKSDGTEISFKKSMLSLQTSMRNISDAYLHSHIRMKETLPNETQVDCKRDLDVLLAEVVRILK